MGVLAGDLAVAGQVGENAPDHVQGLVHRPDAGVGSEIARAVIDHHARDGHLGVGVCPVHLDIGVTLVVLQAHVEARAVFLDQVHLEDQRLELRAGDDPLDIGDVLHQLVGLVILVAAVLEIGAHAVLQDDRLADVDHLALVILVDVTARFGGEVIEDALEVRGKFHVRRRFYHALEAHRAAIRAHVAAAGKLAGLAVAADDLTAPEERAVHPADQFNRVLHIFQLLDGLIRNAFFERNGAVVLFHVDAEARQIQRCLWVETVIQHAGEHLHVTLRLHETAHHAEGGVECAVISICCHAGDDGVVGALARLQPVGVIGIETEIGAAVLQGEAPAARHDTGSEAHVIAVDERAGVALAVHHAEIDRVAAELQRETVMVGFKRVIGIDRALAFLRISPAEQLFERGGGECWIRHVLARVGKGDAQRFDLEMQALGGDRRQDAQVVDLEQVERQQCRQPLPVGWALPDLQPSVFHRDGLFPCAGMGCQVAELHAAPGFSQRIHDRPGDLTLVESLLPIFRDHFQCPRQAGIAEDLARVWTASIDGQLCAVERGCQLARCSALPKIRGDGCHREALLRQADGRGKDIAQRQRAQAFDQVAPAGAGTGHGDVVGVIRRQLVLEAFLLQPLQRKRRRCPPGAVQRAHLAARRRRNTARSSRRPARWRSARSR